ncbi:MAG: hypothetical protein LBR26_16015 [Prevotella sp.]|jgi:hypothetical protein|nr:hypothetical protein [Prevotella sp.]
MENNTAIQTVNADGNLPAVLNSAPEILMQNQASKTKAGQAYNRLEDLVADNGMSDFYDGELAKFVDKSKKTIAAMNDRRKPVTQMIDFIKKEFTSLESDMKGFIDKAQTRRNLYATQKIKIKLEEERKAQIKLARDKEIIEFRKECEISISNFFADAASKKKKELLDHFNGLTLETVDKAGFDNARLNFDNCCPKGVQLVLQPGAEEAYRHLTGEEKQAIRNEYLNAGHSEQKALFNAEIQSQLRELADKIPSKKQELQTIALADAKETERLLKEKQEREKAEAERIRLEDEQKKKEAQALATVKAAGEHAAAIVDMQVNLTAVPNVVESYAIQVDTVAAYLMLAQFWFEKEGKDLPVEKFEKFTFARVKAFCENYAVKNNEFVKNGAIVYEPKYKAR